MKSQVRRIAICFLLLASAAPSGIAADKGATRPLDPEPAGPATKNGGELAEVLELRYVLNDERATLSQKVDACDQLAAWGPRAFPAIRALVQQLRRRGTLGRHAMKALLANDPSEVVDSLAGVLTGDDLLLRAVAAGALADMPDHADLIVPSVIGLLKSNDSGVREVACSVLEGMGPAASKAVPLLLNELRSDEPINIRAALAALQAIEPGADSGLFYSVHRIHMRTFSEIARSAAKDLDQMGAACALALADLVAESDSDDTQVRASVAAALSHIYQVPPECVPELIELARGNLFAGYLPSPAVQVRAVSFLGHADPKNTEVVAALLRLIRSDDVGDAAATALGGIRDTDGTISDRLDALLGQEVNLRRRAAIALGGDGAQPRRALARLTSALADNDLALRRDSALAIGRIGPDAASATPALAANLRRGDASSAAAASALGAIVVGARAAAPALIAAIRSAPLNQSSGDVSTESDRLRAACATALARIDTGSSATADLLLDSVRRRDWIVREALAPALAHSPARQSLKLALVSLTNDPDELVRVNARCALRELNDGWNPATKQVGAQP